MADVSPISPEDALGSLPKTLRDELVAAYNEITRNYRERRWEPSELNGGKLCEIAYSILRGQVDGRIPLTSSKPSNMVDACRDLEHAPSAKVPRSVRIQIPRMIMALYEIRNNRGVGHVGGDVNPNQMDATCILYMSKWIMAELMRLFHDIDTQAAEGVVEAISERITPVIWQVEGKFRVLDPRHSMKERVLLLLYHSSAAVNEPNLFGWVEHSNASAFRRDVLRQLHRDKLIEYSQDTRLVHLSPKGAVFVEERIL